MCVRLAGILLTLPKVEKSKTATLFFFQAKKNFSPVESGRRALRARLPANHRGYYIAPLASTKKVVLCEAVIFFCAENSAKNILGIL